MFSLRSVCLSVCLSVCRSDNWKSCEQIWQPMSSILVMNRITVRIQESEVQNPDSLDFRITNRFWWNFMESCMGCGLETNCIHFGDDSHHYPDPEVRSGWRSGSGKNCHNLLCWRSADVCALWILLVFICFSCILLNVWARITTQAYNFTNNRLSNLVKI